MKKFQLNKETYHIPEKWEEVTLKMRIKAEEDSLELVDNEALQRVAFISGYANIPLEVLRHTPMPKINKLFEYLKFTNDELPTKPIVEFTYKGEKYNVMDSIMNAEFQDWVSCQTAVDNNKETPHNALPLVLAILCKKEGETLDNYDVEERAKHFMELPMTVVEPLRVFFYQIRNQSGLLSPSYSVEGSERLVNAKAIYLKSILKRQVGLGWWKRLLSTILLKWTMFLERRAKKFFTTIRLKFSKKI